MKINYLDKKLKTELLKRLTGDVDRRQVDEKWISHLITVNQIDGVCTTECCQGHSRFNSSNFRGYISMVLSKEKQEIFDAHLKELLSTYPVATIRYCYSKSFGIDHALRFWNDEIYILNEVVFESYAFQSFIDDCWNPLLEKLNGK